ncbi:MAG: CapA family protein [Lachnospiraceae bacterium]|nr:CapA family protein [Lachnospiraceae bacterium]
MMRQLFDRKIHDIKKYIIILTLFTCLLLSACGKTEQAESIPKAPSVEEHKSETESQPESELKFQPESKLSETSLSEIPNSEPPQEEDTHPYDFTICFAGDINLDENWCTTQYLNTRENGIKDCISPELLTHMNNADIMCLNNEFTYSLRGTPLNGKAYTFRANPERVEILHEMGVDIVKLANNHVYDYGMDALLDTFETLENAGIAYMGAGRNLEQAMTPVYIELDDKTVAFVAASRAEKNKMTPQATEEKPGILRCYDTELFLESIKEAKSNADFVLAYVHWGTEYSYDLEEVQLTTGKDYLDAGADVIIGAHSHCLQGMEYYDGKPIIYSLGNYWFNEKTLDTMLLDLHFYGDDEESRLDVKVIPAIQSGYCTNIVTEQEEKDRIYSFLEEISVNVTIDEMGQVLESDE